MATVRSKSAVSSKTIWFNVITGALAIAGVLPTLVKDMPFIAPETAAAVAAACVVVVNIGNIILRRFSKQPVTMKGGDPVQVPNS